MFSLFKHYDHTVCTYVNRMCCLVHLKKFYGIDVLIKKEKRKSVPISVPMGIYLQTALLSDAGVMPYSSEESPFCFPHCLYQYTSPPGQCIGFLLLHSVPVSHWDSDLCFPGYQWY